MKQIQKIAVIGSGTMGHGIAQTAAQSGFDVILCDNNADKLKKQFAKIEANLTKLVEKQKISADDKTTALKRIVTTTELKPAASAADLVIEAITECVDEKSKLFGELSNLLGDDTLLATNTSSISITLLASKYKNPKNVIGMHFFNPVPVMKLTEVIPALQTSTDTIAATTAVCEKLGKTPATVKDIAGFAVNRILVPMINEAAFALYEGVADAKTIDTTMKLGANHPMGPLELADFVGLDVLLSVLEVYQKNLDPARYKPCPLLRKLVEAGHLGRKTGRGFYEY